MCDLNCCIIDSMQRPHSFFDATYDLPYFQQNQAEMTEMHENPTIEKKRLSHFREDLVIST